MYHERHDDNIEKGDGGINYRLVAYSLMTAVVGLIIYIFGVTVSAQTAKNIDQDAQLANILSITQQNSQSIAVLTRIANDHDAAIKSLQGR